LAWAEVLPPALKKVVHSFLLANMTCQASADSAVARNTTATVPIIPAAATTANIAITIFDWLYFLDNSEEYIILTCYANFL
jgi:hypothetical protein